MHPILERLAARFNPTAAADVIIELLPNLLTASLTVVVFLVIWMLLERALRLAERRTRLDATLASFIRSALKTTLFILAGMSALSELGINTTSLLASLGVVGLTLGFAARDTLSNIISGIFIFWDRPFVIGDLIEVDNHYGRVEVITLRSTRIVTPDGKMLAIPNSTIVNSTVVSYTNFPHLRLDVEITLGTGEDLQRVRDLFLNLVQDDPRYLHEPPPRMLITQIGDYNVTANFQIWLQNEKDHILERAALRERLFELLRTEGVDMPLETLQLAPFTARSQEAA